jgi:exosortase
MASARLRPPNGLRSPFGSLRETASWSSLAFGSLRETASWSSLAFGSLRETCRQPTRKPIVEIHCDAVAVNSGAWRVAAFALAALAYAPLLRSSGFTPSRASFETALFRPAAMPALLVIAIAVWLAWRRRDRLRAVAARPNPVLVAALFAAAAAASAWATLTRTTDLQLASAAALALAFGAAARGGAGVRALALPAIALVSGLAIPRPLEAELVWALQRHAASGAATLLRALGRDVELGSMVLWIGGRQFEVIDGCSGLRGILILSLVALIVRELFASAGARAWAVVALAPLLGHALNIVRIAWVAAGPHPEDLSGFAADHTPQGLAVLGAGTALLYGLGFRLARGRTAATLHPTAHARAPLPWRAAAIALAALAAITLAVPPFPAPRDPAAPVFPEAAADWISEALVPDPSFVGTLPPDQFVHRRYAKTDSDGRVRTVELLVVAETPPPLSTTPLFSSKLVWPGGAWLLTEARRAPLPALDRDVVLSHAIHASGPERALTYLWRARDAGLARESLRSLLALDATPWRRERPRVVVRLVAPTPQGGPVAYDLAKRALDAFAADFRDALAAL